MNFEKASDNQLQQIALNEECSTDYKYKACNQLQIRFVISKYRKCNATNNFDPKLSKYWQEMYQSKFKGW